MTLPFNLALLSAGVLGFRHGFDYDHIAAISDITSVQDSARAMKLSMLYAVGHALTVACLGSAVILFGVSLPHEFDRMAEILVGITLIVLAVYVLRSIFLKPTSELPRSRAALLLSGAGWLKWQARRWFDPHAAKPQPSNRIYDPKSVLVVGIIHGLGAETPTQLMIFLLAADLGGTSKGFLGLGMFIIGLLLMNTLTAAGATGIFRFRGAGQRVERVLIALTSVYSLALGVLFVFGGSSILPPLAGN
jgi:cytochrome c biogenesis protein CcdA